MNTYQKEAWMIKEITNTPLDFDSDLYKLTKEEFNGIIQQLKDI